jgi:hypothetical protein
MDELVEDPRPGDLAVVGSARVSNHERLNLVMPPSNHTSVWPPTASAILGKT